MHLTNAFLVAYNAGLEQIVIPSTYNAVAYLPFFVLLLLSYCHNNHFHCAWNICHDAIIFTSPSLSVFYIFVLNCQKLPG